MNCTSKQWLEWDFWAINSIMVGWLIKHHLETNKSKLKVFLRDEHFRFHDSIIMVLVEHLSIGNAQICTRVLTFHWPMIGPQICSLCLEVSSSSSSPGNLRWTMSSREWSQGSPEGFTRKTHSDKFVHPKIVFWRSPTSNPMVYVLKIKQDTLKMIDYDDNPVINIISYK